MHKGLKIIAITILDVSLAAISTELSRPDPTPEEAVVDVINTVASVSKSSEVSEEVSSHFSDTVISTDTVYKSPDISIEIIVLGIVFIVFVILDWYNALMNFVGNTFSTKLLLALCIVSIFNGICMQLPRRR